MTNFENPQAKGKIKMACLSKDTIKDSIPPFKA